MLPTGAAACVYPVCTLLRCCACGPAFRQGRRRAAWAVGRRPSTCNPKPDGAPPRSFTFLCYTSIVQPPYKNHPLRRTARARTSKCEHDGTTVAQTMSPHSFPNSHFFARAIVRQKAAATQTPTNTVKCIGRNLPDERALFLHLQYTLMWC